MQDINAYLIFDGNCREAMEFYHRVLGGELSLMPFSDTPGGAPPGTENRIIHASIRQGKAILMASDNMPGMPFTRGNNAWISVNCENAGEIERFFRGLSEGGSVAMALQQTFWAERFGMLTDRFGVNWMFNFEGEQKQP